MAIDIVLKIKFETIAWTSSFDLFILQTLRKNKQTEISRQAYITASILRNTVKQPMAKKIFKTERMRRS